MGTIPGMFLGEAGGRPLWSITSPVPEGEAWVPLRQAMADAEPAPLKAMVRAAELAAWKHDHQFCGVCGTPTQRREDEVAFVCPSCQTEFWPRVTPAVIMVIHRGNEILLARHARSKATPLFSCLAGFVETGETAEDAVAREVAEEVGVRIGRPRYWKSQAWPFPHALMLGFHAPWESGEPIPDGKEILQAGWFRRDALPLLPPPLSIARQLIHRYFDGDPLEEFP